MNEEVVVVMHSGSFGASEDDEALDTVLRHIAVRASSDPRGEWADKYGTVVENDVFMMHPFCWCEQDDCPWCTGCDCPATAFHYFIDEQEVTFREWLDFYDREVPKGLITEDPLEWDRRSLAANAHRSSREDHTCDFCQTGGVAKAVGGEPGLVAPHFWYKPTNFKVWWYKYIGRDTETNRTTTLEEIEQIREHCVKSLDLGR